MRKGQEEAPIELMVAVTILTFVLVIGFYVYNDLCAKQFEQKMRATFSQFARDVELVYLGGVGTSNTVQADFSPVGCYGNIESLRMFQGTTGVCNSYLGRDDCAVLAMVITDSGMDPTHPTRSIPLLEVLSLPGNINVKYVDTTLVSRGCPDCLFYGTNALLMEEMGDTSIQGSDPMGDCFCGWHLQYYSFRITKTGVNELKIEKL